MTKPGKADKWAARSERLSAALRENLKRRKEQARERGRPRPKDEETGQQISKETEANSSSPEPEPGASPEFRRNQVRE
ncbi:MAG TPA: hypothetical protein VHU22_07275 [Xanthobacteraceae bacterium]|jgi:hypothetical protein|nr:hypothetical protein [Xanthobacteraceae bacterium]